MNYRKRPRAALSAVLSACSLGVALTLLVAASAALPGTASAASSSAAWRSVAAGSAPSGLQFRKSGSGRLAAQVAPGAPAAKRFRKDRRAAVRLAEQRVQQAAAKKLGAQPVLSYRGAADPTVVRWGPYWITVSTGPAAPRAIADNPGGPWTNIPSALTVLPSWAISGRIWASDLVQVGDTWILYFSAEVAGLGIDGRCIGAAYAVDPTQTFVPDEKPLVCPKKGAVAPKAYDKIKRRPKDMPKSGVIDPEYFKDRGGRQYLMYRTQAVPSSIRIVELPASGRPEGSARSSELVRSNDVIENPTMLRKGRNYILLTSEDFFGDCSYVTTFRRSVKLLDWTKSKKQTLLSTGKTGLCGPGGADLGRGPNNELMLFFHAWTCPALGNCPDGYNYDRTSPYDARRSLFAGTLRFTKNKAPRIQTWVAPIAPPPPPPPPVPTETATPTPTPAVP